jgi:hypothetical protein
VLNLETGVLPSMPVVAGPLTGFQGSCGALRCGV